MEEVKLESHEEIFIREAPLDIKDEIAEENVLESKEETVLSEDRPQVVSKDDSKVENECPVCKKFFALDRSLKKHIKNVHSSKEPSSCVLCDKQCPNENLLRNHIKTHFEKSDNSCNACDKKFNFKRSLIEHMLNFHTVKTSDANSDGLKYLNDASDGAKLMCKICQSSFTRYIDLKTHLESHIDTKLFRCDICKQEFQQQFQIVAHVLTHKSNKETVEESEEQIDQPNDKSNEEKAEGNVKRKRVRSRVFRCEVCALVVMKLSELRAHYLIHRDYKPYVCKVCGKGFRQLKQLSMHKIIHTGEKRYACRFCSKKFFFLKYLKNHMISHIDNCNFACPICSKRFKTESYLNSHILRHNERNQKIECELCQKQISASTFRQHIAEHIQPRHLQTVRKCVCKICGKGHFSKSKLQRHMISHSDERPYMCTVCDSSYKTAHCLKLHQNIHTTDNFLCNRCHKTYKYQKSLKHHSCIPKKALSIEKNIKEEVELEIVEENIKIENIKTENI